MAYCNNCGAPVADGARACQHCGTPVPTSNTTPPAYGSAPSYSAPSYGAPAYGAPVYGAPMGRVPYRSIATAIILSLVTCGIYGIYWFFKLTDETNYALGEPGTSGGTAFLLTLVTCGIYGIYWYYKQGEKLDRLAMKKGQAGSSRGVLYLILGVLGFGVVSYALMQDSLNKLAA